MPLFAGIVVVSHLSFKMEDVLDEVGSAEELRNFERAYHDEAVRGEVNATVKFQYAWCLVRSKLAADIRKGIMLLEELFQNDRGDRKRDYLYFLAVGNARLKEYSTALKYVRAFLSIEPGNQQVLALESNIKKRMDKEGAIGIALAGGAVLAIGGLVGVGIALLSKRK
ncbi:mitochondrial fission 1 protein [Ischnura elegans]|uniref:mitochondrial fission 1 protein n=1 Tax=Ischnura elegans TaxID=197161 RepID=UPI001ED89E9E|nr:mitochondrial fission 1 protein [Ischnura elegans]